MFPNQNKGEILILKTHSSKYMHNKTGRHITNGHTIHLLSHGNTILLLYCMVFLTFREQT